MYKIPTGQIKEKIYYWLECRGLFLEEQKGCRRGSIETGDLLYIDQFITKESKTRRENVTTAWIDNQKAFDIV